MKLTRPLLRSDHVARPDLVDRLQAGRNRRLTLLAAPLGFGKTTLLPEWAGAEPGRAVAWLSLDDDENDPARFFAYVIAALQTAIPHVGDRALATLGMPGAGLITVVLSLLINDLDGVDEPTALVLDDYHVITNAGIRDAVCYLVEHLPEALRLVVSTLAEPHLPLARLRARGELVELRADASPTKRRRRFLAML